MSAMFKLSQEQEKKVLAAVLAVLMLLIIYRVETADKPRTAPLAYAPGAVAHSGIRQEPEDAASNADPLNVFLARSEEKFPGVSRDIFRMANPAPKPKLKPVVALPPPPPPVPQRTPEEIAADQARADLAKFQFLGYLTSKDKTLFLSKDGELFVVQIGDKLLKSYQVKEASADYVELIDTATKVAVRVGLAGAGPSFVPYATVQHQQTQPNPDTTQQPPVTRQILRRLRGVRN